MTLLDIVRTLDSLDKESTIYAVEPWVESSEAVLVPILSTNDRIDVLHSDGKRYLLEVFLAKEILEGYVEHHPEASAEERCNRLIYYAIFDA